MQFLTIAHPQRKRYRAAVEPDVRGRYLTDLDYELYCDPTAEAVAIRFGSDTSQDLPRELWPDVLQGAQQGVEYARECGLCLCCIGMTVLSAQYRDVSATSPGVAQGIADCVYADIASFFTRHVPPLRLEWLTSDVVALAKGIHAKQALEGVPALCDALLEAGCDDPLVIEHLQTCPDHSPSCWVVEMILDQAAARG